MFRRIYVRTSALGGDLMRPSVASLPGSDRACRGCAAADCGGGTGCRVRHRRGDLAHPAGSGCGRRVPDGDAAHARGTDDRAQPSAWSEARIPPDQDGRSGGRGDPRRQWVGPPESSDHSSRDRGGLNRPVDRRRRTPVRRAQRPPRPALRSSVPDAGARDVGPDRVPPSVARNA